MTRSIRHAATLILATLLSTPLATAQVVYEETTSLDSEVDSRRPVASADSRGEGVTYLYDDGSGNTNIGPPSTFDPDMLWGNYFLTVPGGEVITQISVAFGPTFPSLADGPVTFWLLDDPDMDLDPRNASALTSVQATPDVFGNTFFTVDIPPTEVSGAFFVGASAQLLGGQDRPARVDTSHPGDRSWFFYAPDISEVINDLASAPFGTRMDNPEYVIFPGAFMIRAVGMPSSGEPADGLVFSPPIDEGLTITVSAGATATAALTLSNPTDTEIAFTFPNFATLNGGRGLGGPDPFGYSWIDSHEPHGPTFEAVDISASGIEITPLLPSPGCDYSAADEGYQVIDLPFSFPFYGEAQSQVWVSANGFLTFDPHVFQVQCSFSIHDIPNTSRPNHFIAPLWADLHGYTQGRIYSEHLEGGGFVVQWTDWARIGQQGSPNTFQAILRPNGEITFQYLYLGGTFTAATRVGVENQDGTVGLLVASGGDYLEEKLAVRITTAPTYVTDITPASGVLPPGSAMDVVVTVDASSILDGTYTGLIRVATDEVENNVYDYPVTLVVEGEAGCTVDPDAVIFPNTIVGNVSTDTVQVINAGTSACTLTGATTDHDDFAIDFSDDVTVAPGDTASFTIVFEPSVAGPAGATLTFTTDQEPLNTALQGTGIAPPEPEIDVTELTFELAVDATSTQSLTLANVAEEGAADLEFSIALLVAGDRSRPQTARGAGPDTRPATGLREEASTAPLPASPASPTDVALTSNDELVTDGSFEEGTPNPYWDEGSLAFGSPICSHAINCSPNVGSGPHTGDWWVWFGGSSEFEAAFVSQPVTIPDGNAQLSFWLEMPVAQTTGVMRVMMDDDTIFQVTGTSGNDYPTYQEVVLDLTDYADGQERVLRFESQLEAGSFFIDDVSLLAWVPILTVEPRNGILAPGESMELVFTADTEGIDPGTYLFQAVITSNAPQTADIVIPVSVTVWPVGSEGESPPLVFALEQNYPNPFSSATTIEYQLPEAAPVTIEVFDLAGRRMATLVDQEMEAGRHSALWSANGIAAGVYFYRIQAGRHTQTLRALVMH